ncbi:SusC/RagA family TonB-linked outer membrane protein [Snuella sedimenti]|uniref:SusC/RagA family TonB-linked outer membrane protein n=1 Tax=Snuella sedimenti TaxID=2798802 RepID=A0A8J7JBI0_9FLAO|nr:SusC/RagA family TonB-linked outer membrane protein [Snuella sedimenti]MBJ6368059.1 SusC/RagA family TonB-linked outer membrane protein [Snuella sedimenti]
MMRSLIFLFCSMLFSFTPNNILSQNTKIIIEADKVLTVDEVFELIMDQTSFNFIYQEDMFKDFPKVPLKKGVIGANQLLQKSLVDKVFDFKFTDSNTIVLKEKKLEPVANNEEEQQNNITGTVTDNSGMPLPGVNIIKAGTSIGTQTDFDGNYSIQANAGDVLEFSYVGMKTLRITVGDDDQINVILKEDAAKLEEVVVTALGIKKEKKRIGYATQEVKGEALQKVQTANVVESLAGKVAGVTIVNNSGNFFGDPKVFLRGERPLIVVNGVPQPQSDFWNLSSDDIENINVLKGGAASALYGALGKNGAIQITMKSGKGQQGTTISFNSSTTFQAGFLSIPKAQTQYGPGNTGRYRFGGGLAGGDGLTEGGPVNDFDYSIWGPKFNGQLIEQYDSPIDPVTGYRIPTPWVSRGEDNLRNFIETGLITSNNLTITSGSDKGSFVVSNTYKYAEGQIPGQRLDINTLRLSGNLNVSDAVSVEASLQYNYQYADNRIRPNYGPSSPIYLLSLWGGAHFDVRDFKHVWKPGKEGIEQDFVENWRYNNPYALAYAWKRPWTKNDILTFAKVNFKISDHLSAYVRTTLNSYNLVDNEEISKGIYDYSIPDRNGRFRYSNRRFFENNTDFLITYNNKFFGDEFEVTANIGGNQRFGRDEFESASTTQLIIPEVFTLSNSVDQVTPNSSKYEKGVYSAYTSVDLAYQDWLYFGFTGRIDNSSTLVPGNDSFFYPSVYTSFVASELFDLPEVISFLKLRSSWSKVGDDYLFGGNISNTYEAFNSYGRGRTRNVPTANFPGLLENPLLEPSFNTAMEVGVEMKLFNGRFGIDFSYFENTNGPAIYSQDFSLASGWNGIRFNGRETQRRGMDFSITGTPIQTADFKWTSMFNFAKFKDYLTKLPPLPDGTPVLNEGNTKVGDELGHYWYPVWERVPDGEYAGQHIINADGRARITPYNVDTGAENPDFEASINNTFTYKNFTLNFLLAGRFGGITQDEYDYDLWRTGSHPDAVHPERELSNIAYVNGTDPRTMQIPGVAIVSGDVTYDDFGNILEDTRVFEPSTYKLDYQTWASRYAGAWQNLIKERTFLKLREVSISYNFPKSILDKTFMKTASISIIGRDLWYWSKDKSYIDFDAWTYDSDRDVDLQLPTPRSFGFNLNFTF